MKHKKYLGVLSTLLFSVALILSGCNKTPKHEHTFASSWSKDATYHWHAATCEHTEETSDKAEHSFGNWVVDTDATYTQAGSKHRICSVCEYREDAIIPIIAHDHVAGAHVNENIVEADCTHAGSHDEVTYCSICYEELSRIHVVDEALGHIYVVTATVAPTYEADGYKTYTCSRCGDHYNEKNGDKLTHHYADYFQHDESTHWHPCIDEGYEDLKGDEAPHIFDQRDSLSRTRKCECGYSDGRYYQSHVYLHSLVVDEVYDKNGFSYDYLVSADQSVYEFGFVTYTIGENEDLIDPSKGDNYSIPEEMIGKQVVANVYLVVLDETKMTYNGNFVDVDLLYGDNTYTPEEVTTSTYYDDTERTCYLYRVPVGEVSIYVYNGETPIVSDDGKTLTYGLYPQTHVNDTGVLNALNALTTPEANGWYKYLGHYYCKYTSTPTYVDLTFSDGTSLSSNKEYWFLCEPIVWNIVKTNGSQRLLTTQKIIDARIWGEYWNKENEDGKYCNNYAISSIRSFLNDGFYNLAFMLNASGIIETEVDNSGAQTDEPTTKYACENTNDKIFLFSYAEYQSEDYGYAYSFNRKAQVTDYAIARGMYMDKSTRNGHYYTRSPNHSKGYSAVWYIKSDGMVKGDRYTNVNEPYYGARPCMTLTLN